MKKSLKRAAILSALSLCLTPHISLAYQTDYIYNNGAPWAEFIFLDKGEGLGVKGNYFVDPAEYDFSDYIKKNMKSATSYWVNILGSGTKNTSPWQIFITSKAKFQNAAAATTVFTSDGKNDKINLLPHSYLRDFLEENKAIDKMTLDIASKSITPAGTYVFSDVTIGQNMGANKEGAVDGWYSDTDTIIPTNEQANDFIATFRHELGHALGISIREVRCDENGKVIEKGAAYDTNNNIYFKFDPDLNMNNNNQYTAHLVDQNGNQAKAGMMIISNDTFNRLKEKNPNISKSDYFIVDNLNTNPNLDGSKVYAFFKGEKVSEVLNGKTFFGVNGIPIQGWETASDDYNANKENLYMFEGSHLQTPGMMSHRPYSNYTTFLEAELAVMQDMGYKMDRRAFFGRSIYNDGQTIINNDGYFARNADGSAYTNAYSQIPLGVGLHIFGSNNKITQNANILTQGSGAAGIRVDGLSNSLNIAKNIEIHSDGYRGKGVLVAYGRNHNINQEGTVTATGEGGIATEFNFGSSSNGATDEYRGSYIRYERKVDGATGNITSGENLTLTGMKDSEYNYSKDELDDALVDNYNISGVLKGGKNAIYIGKNAFVKNINVNNGANISGDITSDWKHFSDASYNAATPIALQYKGASYSYDKYIPNLVTNLNFNANTNYGGNINGSDNMRMNVNSGTLNYSGTANVAKVTVNKGASLFGGNYVLNDMSAVTVDGQETTGVFENKGTIGATDAKTNMTIKGKLDSSGGNIRVIAGGEGGKVVVTGEANVAGAKVTANDLKPGQSVEAVQAGSVNGQTAKANSKINLTPMIEQETSVKDNSLYVTSYFEDDFTEDGYADNFDDEDDRQDYLDSVTSIRDRYQTAEKNGDEKTQNALTPALFMEENELKETALDSMKDDPAIVMGAVQQNSMINNIIENRVDAAFSAISTDKKPENNAWVKFGKQWGDVNGGINYHGQTISGGYDKILGKNLLGGVFVGYNSMNFGGDGTSHHVYDTRLGVYAGYKQKQHNAFMYLDYGWQRNKNSHYIRNYNETASAKYSSHIIELGGEYKYDIHAENNKIWRVSPFVNAKLSYMKQNAYSENGSEAFNRNVEGKRNTYAAATLGVEFKRYLNRGNYAFRLGVRQGLTGVNPELKFAFAGDDKSYSMRNDTDKTHFLVNFKGEAEFKKGWIAGLEASLLKGKNDKDVSASFMFKRVW